MMPPKMVSQCALKLLLHVITIKASPDSYLRNTFQVILVLNQVILTVFEPAVSFQLDLRTYCVTQ